MNNVDFTIRMRQECSRGIVGSQHFQLSTYQQTVDPMNPAADYCGCKGFSFRRDCKHVREAREIAVKNELCWSEDDGDLAQTMPQECNMICPRCGGPTRMVKVAT